MSERKPSAQETRNAIGLCARGACGNKHQNLINPGTGLWYCNPCRIKINAAAPPTHVAICTVEERDRYDREWASKSPAERHAILTRGGGKYTRGAS